MLSSAPIARLRPLALRRAALFILIEVAALLCRRHLQVDLTPVGGDAAIAFAALAPMSWAFLANDRFAARSGSRRPNDQLLRYLRFCTCSCLGLLLGLAPVLLAGNGQQLHQHSRLASGVLEIGWDYASTVYAVW